MKGEDLAGAVVYVVVIAEAGKDVGCLVGEADVDALGCVLELAFGIALGLFGNIGKLLALVVLLGLNQATGDAIDEYQVVAGAGRSLPLTDNHATSCSRVKLLYVLHDVTSGRQLIINSKTCLFFRAHPNRQPFIAPRRARSTNKYLI